MAKISHEFPTLTDKAITLSSLSQPLNPAQKVKNKKFLNIKYWLHTFAYIYIYLHENKFCLFSCKCGNVQNYSLNVNVDE